MFLGTDIQFLCEQRGSAMRRADLQEERSAAQREGPSAEGAALVPLQDSDVVRDGDTYYLVINNLGERCVLFSARFTSLVYCSLCAI